MKVKQLNTLPEVLIALGNGKAVKDMAQDAMWASGNEILYRTKDNLEGALVNIGMIKYPCTIIEDTKYFYETTIRYSDGTYGLSGDLLQDIDIGDNRTKTGRKFIENIGRLVEVKE